MSVTSGFPLVKVPVLSKTIVVNLCAVSSASAFLIKMPFSAPFTVPTIIAVGVASPRAQGHAIIKTATKIENENRKGALIAIKLGAIKYQNKNDAIAIRITMGTKIPATLSASLCIGAFEPCASSTSLIIWASIVSLPTWDALTFSMPFLFIVAPTTLSFNFFETGMLSPVIIDSSTWESP